MSIFYTDVSHRGGKIYLRYADGDSGVRKQQVIDFKPELYVRATLDQPAEAKSMWDEPLSRLSFTNKRDMDEFIEQYKDINGFNIYGMRDPIYQFITKMFKGEVKHNSKYIRGSLVDIETFSGDIDDAGNPIQGPFPDPQTAEYPVSAITMYCTHDKTFHAWGLEHFKGHFLGSYVHNPEHPKIGKLKVEYRGFASEYAMLQDFVEFWSEIGSDYWSGWNIQGFDNPYLTNRIEKVCGDASKKLLSPWGVVTAQKSKTPYGKEETYYDYMGCAMLDYKELFQKHGYMNPDNYRLQTVVGMVLGESKVDYGEEAVNLNTLYITNFQKYIEYNIHDSNLILMLDNKMQLIDLTFTLAYLTKSNYNDTLGTVRPWSALAYSMLHERGIEPLLRPVFEGDTRFAGGFVREPKTGLYRWVVSCDLNSLNVGCLDK